MRGAAILDDYDGRGAPIGAACHPLRQREDGELTAGIGEARQGGVAANSPKSGTQVCQADACPTSDRMPTSRLPLCWLVITLPMEPDEVLNL